MSSPLQHVVLFRFTEPLSDQDQMWMTTQVQRWPDEIGGFRQLRFGADITGARAQGFSYLLFQEFDSQADLVRYQQHPVHQEFLAWIVDRKVDVLAFDYLLDERTDLLTGRDPARREQASRDGR